MKLKLIAAVLSCCALLSFAYGDVVPTEQSLAPLKEESQEQLVAVEEPISVQSLELQKILGKIPELVQNAADKKFTDDTIDEVVDNNTEVVPQEAAVARSREGKQLIGFIPTYVLREAIRMAQEQQDNIVGSLDYDDRENDDDEDDEDAIEEERAIRRRKRFRRRNSKGHLQTSHRHQNLNKQRVTQRRRVNMKHQKEKRRKGSSKRKSPKKKQKKRRTKKRKPTKRRQQYDEDD